MKKALKAVFAAAVIFTILLSMLPGAFTLRAGAVSEQSAADGIFSDELKRTGAKNIQALLDGVYAQNAGITSDWLVFSLIQYEGGKYDYSKYASSLKKYSSGSGYDNSVTKERIALMFAAMNTGGDYIGKTVNNEINGLGIMSRIYGLHLLANGYSSSSVTVEAVPRNNRRSIQLHVLGECKQHERASARRAGPRANVNRHAKLHHIKSAWRRRLGAKRRHRRYGCDRYGGAGSRALQRKG